MSRTHDVDHIISQGIVAVVRSPDSNLLVNAIRALADGGVTVAEVTMTVPNALEVIRDVCRNLSDRVLLGAGTVLDPETARSVILAGAQFVVSPCLDLDVIRMCHRYDKAVMPGALTPTEVLSAWESGADIVKVFPADLGGPAYLKALKAPLPQIRLMPTGGVNQETAAKFLAAGACCLGVGSAMVDTQAIKTENWGKLTRLAEQYAAILSNYRNSNGGSS